MKVIAIGKKYEDAFNGIFKLVSEGAEYAPSDISVKEVKGVRSIFRGDYEFRFVLDAREVASTNVDLCFCEDGASWFKALRGDEGSDTGMAEWIKMIDDVSEFYHKAFSYIEYKQTGRERSEADMERGKKLLEKIIHTLLPQISGAEIVENRSEDNVESVYGLSLKLDVNGGAGMSQPILGKVFFRATPTGLNPIADVEAKEIDESIKGALTQTSVKTTLNDADDGTIDEILTALDRTFKNGYAFANALCLGEKDEEIVEDILSQSSRGNLTLEITGVRTLGVSHVKWINRAYDVIYEGVPTLKAIVGIDGAISLTCLHCRHPLNGENVLIEKNHVYVTVENELGETEERDILLYNQEGLGISIYDLNLVKEKFGLHLASPCKEVKIRGGNCVRLVCYSDMRNLGTVAEPIWRCVDCPYPEVVYGDGSLVKRATPTLAYARDLRALIAKENVAECSVCKRTFSNDYMVGSVCKFCSSKATTMNEKSQAKRRYKKYASLFPTVFRLKNINKVKYCFEQEDMVLFLVGGERYVFNKAEAEESGYLTPPRKVVLSDKGGRK